MGKIFLCDPYRHHQENDNCFSEWRIYKKNQLYTDIADVHDKHYDKVNRKAIGPKICSFRD